MLRNLIALVVATCLCVVGEAESRAQAELAVSHFQAGSSYYKQGRYTDAIREFREAYDLSKKPALLYNIAQALERLGRTQDAVSYYERYLKESKSTDQTLAAKIVNLKKAIRSTAVAIDCNVKGASVLIDSKIVGTTPLRSPMPVGSGTHEIRVEKSGYQAFIAQLGVSSGSTLRVRANLVPSAQQTNVGHGSAAGASNGRSHLWSWVSFGVAGASILTGAITGVMALGKADDAQTSNDAKADGAKTLALVSDITIAVGVAAAVTGVVLWFVQGSSSESRGPKSAGIILTPAIGPSYGGVAATFAF